MSAPRLSLEPAAQDAREGAVVVPLTLPAEALEAIARRAAELVLAELDVRSAKGAASEFLSVSEAAEVLRSRRQRVYDLLSAGSLTRHRDGARVLVERRELLAYLAGESTGPVAHRLPTGRRGRTTSGVAR